MTKVVSGSSWADIVNLINFVLASYGAMLMFAVHLLLVGLAGAILLRWTKSDPGADLRLHLAHQRRPIPMNVATQNKLLGIPDGIANFAASFGATTSARMAAPASTRPCWR